MTLNPLSAISRAIKGRILSLASAAGWAPWVATRNYSGQVVNEIAAMQLSAAWASCNLISGTMSTLPFDMARKGRNGSWAVDDTHPLQTLLKYSPNADMTAVIFWRIFFLALLLRGEVHVEIKRTAGRITSLFFLWPDRVTRKSIGIGTAWEWQYNDPDTRTVRTIDKKSMWHTPFYTLDGVTAISPIRMGANVLGGAIAADRAAADTFTKGLKSPGVLLTKDFYTPAQREAQRQHFKDVNENGGLLVVEAGADFKQLSMTPQDAELLSTREFGIAEVCSWWGVNPTMIGRGSDKNSNWGTGLSQQKQGFVDFCLRQFAVTVEASIRKNLIDVTERAEVGGGWIFEGLLRGNPTERAGYYSTMTQNGVMTRDEAREKEGLPLMSGNAAVLTVQSNMLPIDKLGEGTGDATIAQDAVKAWLGITQEAKDAPQT